jgi:ornithine cyclodeaminase
MMQLEAMLTARRLEKVFVVGANFQRTLAFVDKMRKEFSRFETEIIAVENGNEVVALADIITVATTSHTPVFDGTLVKKGAHVNGIGAYTPLMQELPEAIIQSANKIFFDTSEGVLAEAGDIIIPLKNGSVKMEDFHGDLGQVILGTVKGRETDQEITLFKSVGTAVLDVVTAHYIYKKSLEQGVGQHVEM